MAKRKSESAVSHVSTPDPIDQLTTREHPEAGPAGRPKGAKTRERPEAVLRPAQCPGCKSSRREAFRDGTVAEEFYEVELGGERYNHLLWRNTRCRDCGQYYRVIEYRYDPPSAIADTPSTPELA